MQSSQDINMQEDSGEPNVSYSDSEEEVKVQKQVAQKRVPDATSPSQITSIVKEATLSLTKRPNSPA
jgi:hypothetical protein